MSADTPGRRGIPEATVARLPAYLRVLTGLGGRGVQRISSGELADAAGVTSAQLRKDLSFLGSHGVRGVGYPVATLADEIGRRLGLTRAWPVVIVGMGRLGQAVARYPGLAERGFHVRALFDHDQRLVGRIVEDLPIRHTDELAAVVSECGPVIGVIATPAEAAQQVCDRMVEVGIRSILNFAPGRLQVAAGVRVRTVDVATEMQILTFHAQPEHDVPVPVPATVQPVEVSP